MSHALPPAQIALLTAQSPLPLAARMLVAAAVIVTKWHVRRRTRMELNQLEKWQLDDIGLTYIDARIEAAKPFWQD